MDLDTPEITCTALKSKLILATGLLCLNSATSERVNRLTWKEFCAHELAPRDPFI